MPGRNDEAIAAFKKATGMKDLDDDVVLEVLQQSAQIASDLMKQKKEAEAAEAA